MTKIKWWGYLHTNGTIQMKRWLGDYGDAHDSPFVVKVFKPFEAPDRESAMEILKQRVYDFPPVA
jgi:hypothetical protein